MKLAVATALFACLAALGLSAYVYTRQQSFESDRAAREAEVAKLRGELDALRGKSAAITGRLQTAEKKLTRKEAGIAPLAARVLRSVFTVHTDTGIGSGFVAWRENDASYLITAYHVVAGLVGSNVTLSRKDGSWAGELTAIDPKHDLALIRMGARPAGAEPLWQRPDVAPPRTGDELLLVGSPFGFEGTVTTGVVSRVTKREIQTDAAANPGNSGGPAIGRDGRAVGVLRSGGGQNVNFAVPMARVCAKLRRCR